MTTIPLPSLVRRGASGPERFASLYLVSALLGALLIELGFVVLLGAFINSIAGDRLRAAAAGSRSRSRR
jgi:hypothetical protein